MANKKTAEQQDAADENATAGMEEVIANIALQPGGALVASITETMLDVYKNARRSYADATQGQQQDVFRQFEDCANRVVSQVAEIVAAGGDEAVRCIVGDLKVGNDISFNVKLAPMTEDDKEAAVIFLMHRKGKQVMVRSASVTDYNSEPAVDPSQPDQTGMEFDAGSDTVDPPSDDSDLAGEDETSGDDELETANEEA